MKIYMAFIERKFNLGTLDGISEKTITEHVKLYAGYVKHANLILDKITEMSVDAEKNTYAIGELQRRFGFEFDGMRNHEYYFEQFEGGASELPADGKLMAALVSEWGSFEAAHARINAIALTRGIGWAIMYYDSVSKRLVNAWVDEQHLGHLIGLNVVLAIDMWEHSYLFDYVPGDKKKYVEAFFRNLNGEHIEKRFVSYLN